MTRLWSNLDPAAVVRNCPASEIEAILRDAVAEIVRRDANEAALLEALGPVLDWYQSDEHPKRPLHEIVADIASDLRHDRPLALRTATLEEALSDLVSWFPENKPEPEYRINAGPYGAVDAVEHARATLCNPTPDEGEAA